jgi:L-threonylcarbamoyladenylate synthase
MEFNPKDIDSIALQIKEGAVGIFSCDTILGLVALPTEANSQRIQQIKQRQNCPFILLLPSLHHCYHYCQDLTKKQSDFLKQVWPGPVTVILNKSDNVSSNITANKTTIGLRYPSFSPLNYLLNQVDEAIISTSVNTHGSPPALTETTIPDSIRNQVDFIYTKNSPSNATASTIVDLSNDQLAILRQGDFYIDPNKF